MDPKQPEEEDEVMDQFMDKFRTQKYKGAFNEETWEEEFEKIPLFMKKTPDEIDPEKTPELACLQSMLFDSDCSLEDQAKAYKEEGNDYFKGKNYKKAIIAYTEGIKKSCEDTELNAVLYSNRAAAQFRLGNFRSSLNDAIAARKHKPNHLKAVIRGALCYVEIKNFTEALKWCNEGLMIDPTDKKLLETRVTADKLHREAERDIRKLRYTEKKTQAKKESILCAIKDRGIKLFDASEKKEDDGEDEETSGTVHNDLFASKLEIGAQVFLDENGRLHWPVMFLYPEHNQTDLICEFDEDNRIIDHLNEMFQDLPPWDTDRKYLVSNLEIFFCDEKSESFYEVNPDSTLLQAMQHSRFWVKDGLPYFLVLVKQSPFSKKYFSDKKLHRTC